MFKPLRNTLPLLLLLLIPLALTACVEEDPNIDDPEVCVATAVLAQNPDTGVCEWVNSCDTDWEPCADIVTDCEDIPADLCELNTECELVEANSCICFDDEDCNCDPEPVQVCQEKEVADTCAELDEHACLADPTCEPVYGWIGMPDCDSMDCMTDSDWAFMGCVEVELDCYQLNEVSCIEAAECQWIEDLYDTPMPCYCEEGEDCKCEADPPIGGFCEPVPVDDCYSITDPASCEERVECDWYEEDYVCACGPGEECDCLMPEFIGYCGDAQPESCYDITDEESCYISGCDWIFEAMPMPCECYDGEEDCRCAQPDYYENGYCVPPQVESCYDYYDPDTCLDMGCEWIDEYGYDEMPIPDCDPDDMDCGNGLVYYPGFCQPPTGDACEEIVDPESCFDREDCEWLYFNEPCVCEDGDEYCNCGDTDYGICSTVFEPVDCFDLYDEFSCQDNPECQWVYLDYEETCVCEDGEECYCGEPAPFYGYCEPRPVEPINCYDLWDEFSCQENPECQWVYYYDDMPMPDECIDEDGDGDCDSFMDPYGFCEPRPVQPISCYDLWDEYSCLENPECQWTNYYDYDYDECIDEDGDGNCDAFMDPYGFCEPAPIEPVDCYEIWDEFTCMDSPECQWVYEDIFPCECDADDPECMCAGLVAPGYCEPRPVDPESCFDIYDEYSCTNNPDCLWIYDDTEPYPCDCDENDPTCVCPALPIYGYCEPIPVVDPCNELSQGECMLDHDLCEWVATPWLSP